MLVMQGCYQRPAQQAQISVAQRGTASCLGPVVGVRAPKLRLQLHLESGSDAVKDIRNSCIRSLQDPQGPEPQLIGGSALPSLKARKYIFVPPCTDAVAVTLPWRLRLCQNSPLDPQDAPDPGASPGRCWRQAGPITPGPAVTVSCLHGDLPV